MKIKLTALTCLMLSLSPSSTILPSAMTMPATQSYEYLPITDFQRALSNMMCNFMPSCFSPKTIETTQQPVAVTTKVNASELSREDALETMKLVTTKLFDPQDVEFLSTHLLALKELTEYLDQEIDKKTITAIHYLLANQHRSEILFWLNANNEYEFNKVIPTTAKVAAIGERANALTLHKKLTIQARRIKDEERMRRDQLQNQPLVVPVA